MKTITYLFPVFWQVGKGPKMSVLMRSKGLLGTGIGMTWERTFTGGAFRLLHGRQDLTQFTT